MAAAAPAPGQVAAATAAAPPAAEDSLEATQAYLAKHHIHELMEGLLAELMFHKPANPQQWLVAALEKAKVAGTRPLLDAGDLDAMFRLFDVTQRAHVSQQQADTALATVLGARRAAAAAAAIAGCSGGGSSGGRARSSSVLLGQEQFVRYCGSVLAAATPLCKGLAEVE